MNYRKLALLVAGAALSVAATGIHAQQSPNGPIRIVVPFDPASTPDQVARAVADRLGPRLGQTLVVENKAGAAGNIGTDAVAKAAPDGQTIGVSIAGPLAINPLLFKKMPYDPARDLELLTVAVSQPAVLVVAQKHAVHSAKDLSKFLQDHRGKLSYASIGAGSVSHLAMETLSSRSGAELVHVPYRGSGAAVGAILAGEVDMGMLPAAAVMPHIKAGKLRGLAIASAKRSPSLPDYPTLSESGLPDVQADAWIGFIAPAKTPAAIVKKLRDEIVQVLNEPAVKDRLRTQYMDVVGNTPAEFRALLAADAARWKPIIQKQNIALD